MGQRTSQTTGLSPPHVLKSGYIASEEFIWIEIVQSLSLGDYQVFAVENVVSITCNVQQMSLMIARVWNVESDAVMWRITRGKRSMQARARLCMTFIETRY